MLSNDSNNLKKKISKIIEALHILRILNSMPTKYAIYINDPVITFRVNINLNIMRTKLVKLCQRIKHWKFEILSSINHEMDSNKKI